jgi:hypothetical protein
MSRAMHQQRSTSQRGFMVGSGQAKDRDWVRIPKRHNSLVELPVEKEGITPIPSIRQGPILSFREPNRRSSSSEILVVHVAAEA